MLWDLGLEKYIMKDAKAPETADRDNPTQDEKEASHDGKKVMRRHVHALSYL